MRRRGGWAAVAGVTAVVGFVLAGTPSASAERTLVARWEMNESASANVMADTGPNGLDGDIGDEIDVGGGTYRWSVVDPVGYRATTERLVVVEHDPALDPGLQSFEIEMRYRSDGNYGNIVQKGQNGSPTGFWKFEHPWGLPSCAFKDANGVLKAVLGRTETFDGAWHVIRCEFDREFGDHGRLRVFVDGRVDQVNVLSEPLGPIANDQPLVIGGKRRCNQDTVSCDYFWGEIDYVEIRIGGSAPGPGPTTTAAPTTTEPSVTTTTVASGPPIVPGGIDTAATAGAGARRGDRAALD